MRVVSVFGFPLPFLLMGPAALFFLQYSVVPSRGQSHNTPPRDHTDPFDLDFTHQRAERLVARADTPRTGRFPLTFTPPNLIKAGRLQKKRSRKPKGFSPSRETQREGWWVRKKTPTGPPPFHSNNHPMDYNIPSTLGLYHSKAGGRLQKRKAVREEHTTNEF